MSQTGQSKTIKDWNKYEEDNKHILEWNAQIKEEMDMKMWEIQKAKDSGNMLRAGRLKTEWNNLRDQEII